jgi:hypothetical protein
MIVYPETGDGTKRVSREEKDYFLTETSYYFR